MTREREEAIKHIKDIICENNSIKPNIVTFEREKEALYMAISALEQEPCPSVTPSRRKGHWIYRREDKYSCSKCGTTTRVDEAGIDEKPMYKFCPYCGAEMESEE